MGSVHKLKPEILNFILASKQDNSVLSCRNLTHLVFDKFQIKVSKSSINSIFKANNLSMPIGRRQKQKKRKFNMPVLPVIEGSKAITVVAQTKVIEDKTINATGELSVKSQEEERVRAEVRLSSEKQRLKTEDETRKRVLEEASQAAMENKRLEEESRKLEEARLHDLAKEVAENNKRKQEELLSKRLEEESRKLEEARLHDLAKEVAENNKRKQEELRKLEEEKAAQEAELKTEKERWIRLAEAEQKSKQQIQSEEVVLPKIEFTASEILPESRVCSGAILLKALDCLIGGSKEINAAFSRVTGDSPEDSLHLTEALIFKSLFDKDNFSALGDLIGVQYSQEELDNYYVQIKQLKDIKLDTAKVISNVFTEAKGVAVHFIDGGVIHLDGQLHSSWPTFRFPYDFSSTVYDLKNNLKRYFFQDQRLVLFSAFGYDVLPKDFFTLVSNMSKDNQLVKLVLFGNELNELESVPLNHENRCPLVFGLWPWQFTSSRKVRKIGEFSLKHVASIDQDMYLGEIEIDLLRVSLNQSLSFKGCAIKTNPSEKIRLVVLSTDAQMSLEELASAYLSHWPNFEEAFQDFSRKIELFTYSDNEQKFIPKERFQIITEGSDLELGDIFINYIQMLDLYLRWHFLPSEHTEKDFTFTSQNFYNIPVNLIAGEGKVIAKIQIEPNYKFIKDLEYLIRRLNERQINLVNGARLCFESVFK
jgi:hypothetical protein